MNFRKINNIAGWIIGGIATLVYLLTMEATASFWDCGEFLSCANKIEVGHSPGAPLFMLMQRMFGILAGGNLKNVAYMINAWSAIASGLTILFLFWTITHLAKKLVSPLTEPDNLQRILIIGAGAVGALAYTFSDTFWFSAVEAEVYATSSLFTAVSFWAIFKWENVADKPHADRWLLLIAYLVGLSIGVHLLNLLTIPVIAMVYYFRRYKATVSGTFIAFLVGIVCLALVQFGVIQGITIIASKFDVLFVNDFHLPFDIGALFGMALLIGATIALLIMSKRKGWYLAHTGILCIIFIMIGFSSYIVPIIRSRADVPIDMTNPDNTLSLVSYVQREQFGEQPLLYGPDFDAKLESIDSKGDKYAKSKTPDGKDFYEVVGKKPKYVFESEKMRFFPRIYDSNDPQHVSFYKQYLGIEGDDRPTTGDNLAYFFGYQMNWMWWRYFMWNYVGRQNDFEGQGEAKNGNWVSGIPVLDNTIGRLLGGNNVGDMNKMADGYKNNGARNELYYLPFILGIMGLVFQFNRSRKDGIVVGVLFFFTGIAIGIYLNMPPLQPRERDYAFAGSTYAFAIWIGLGVLMLYEWIKRVAKGPAVAFGVVGISLLAVPVLMAAKEWDDHDRSKKTLARATAYNTLMSLDKNAVLFTFGDNETYPLWYAQEIEGIRPDVRVINTSLLGIDWYIEQLNYKINDADAIPMVWKREDFIGDRRNYLRYVTAEMAPQLGVPNIPQDRFFPLADICKYMVEGKKLSGIDDQPVNYYPTKKFTVPVPSKGQLVSMGIMYANDTANTSNEMQFTITKDLLQKDDIAQLNILAMVGQDGWKRPIYYSNLQEMSGYGDLVDYMRLEGTVYRLMPYRMNKPAIDPNMQQQQEAEQGFVDVSKSYNLFMNTYIWGGGERKDVYFDEKNRQMFISYRIGVARLADKLTESGRKEDAIKVLDRVMNGITEHAYSYDFTALFMAEAYYHAGATKKAGDLTDKLVRNMKDDVRYIASLPEKAREGSANDAQRDISIMYQIYLEALKAGDTATADRIINTLSGLATDTREMADINTMVNRIITELKRLRSATPQQLQLPAS